jgi:hypothetical protein
MVGFQPETVEVPIKGTGNLPNWETSAFQDESRQFQSEKNKSSGQL